MCDEKWFRLGNLISHSDPFSTLDKRSGVFFSAAASDAFFLLPPLTLVSRIHLRKVSAENSCQWGKVVGEKVSLAKRISTSIQSELNTNQSFSWEFNLIRSCKSLEKLRRREMYLNQSQLCPSTAYGARHSPLKALVSVSRKSRKYKTGFNSIFRFCVPKLTR